MFNILRRLVIETRGMEPDLYVSWEFGGETFAAVHYRDNGMEWLEVVKLIASENRFETVALEVVEDRGDEAEDELPPNVLKLPKREIRIDQ